jgi:hypothetical protein
MEVVFLTPDAAAFVVAVLLPLAVLAGRERRLRGIRRELGLTAPRARGRVLLVAAVALVPLLLALAATQPVLEDARAQDERTDAEIFVVVDTSRSMLASSANGAPTRFERARTIALRLQQSLSDVPMGVGSMTDRVLPHLFPTIDRRVISATLTEALAVDRPPAARYAPLATSLNGLAAIPQTNFFSPTAQRRLLVVLTDGEADEVDPSLARAYRREPRTRVVFVRLWNADERIYETGVAEAGYRPDSELTKRLDDASSLVAGRIVGEDEFGELLSAARDILGSGPTRPRELEGERLALMPYLTLAAFLPLAFVLWRRNV